MDIRSQQPRIRLAWRMPDGTEGHGEFFDASKRESLQAHADAGNLQYGKDTHWIEPEVDVAARSWRAQWLRN
jgi:hypothetical protein